ncbi:MAG: hypothetical protein P1P90_04260 [Patescibacteria group bacterium]|nr:hypothetical protein [Patescibacteria group bacterium]
MEISYPALEGINSPKQYAGPIVLLSFLDVYFKGGFPKYSCGHKAARAFVFRAPKVLYGALKKRELLASLMTYEDVVLFDPEGSKGRILGHREIALCPQCFFEKLLHELDPTCPYCKRRIGHGQNVWLVRYGELNLEQRRFIKVLKAKHEGYSWAVCCCSSADPREVMQSRFVWNGKSRTLIKP